MRFILLFFMVLIGFSEARSQMFSVTSKKEETNLSLPGTTIGVIYQPISFNRVENQSGTSEFADFSFNNPFYHLTVEGRGLEVRFGVGSGLGNYDGSAINFAIAFLPELFIYRSQWIQVLAPFQVKTEFMRIRSQQDEFAQNIGSLGTGLGVNLVFNRKFLISTRIKRNLGYNVRGFGTNQGRFIGTEIPTRILIGRLANNYGVTIGHTYSIGNMDIRGDVDDYNFESHSFVIGVNF